jgi:putative intracellular protease/amidase
MRIACLLDNEHEDSEFCKPYEVRRAAGHDVVFGFEASLTVLGHASAANA